MAGSITISSIILDSDNNFSIRSNTGATLFSANNSGLVTPAGTVSLPAITTTGDTNTGIFFPAADTIAFTEGGVESMRIDSSGNVGIGTDSPSFSVDVVRSGGNAQLRLMSQATGTNGIIFRNNAAPTSAKGAILYPNGSAVGGDTMQFVVDAAERMRIDSSGNVAIGNTSALVTASGRGNLTINGSSSAILVFGVAGVSQGYIFNNGTDLTTLNDNVGAIIWENNGAERMRITSGGDVAIGATSAIFSARFGVKSSNNTLAAFVGNDAAGTAYFVNTNGSGQVNHYATFETSGINCYHAWWTTTSGASQAQKMTLDVSGNLLVGKTSASGATAGAQIESIGVGAFTSSGNAPVYVNRLTSDGTLVSLRQDTTEEGTISVSGSTVSYNGGHLSRWSQLPDGSKDDTILKGTVLTNLDDMCVWEKDGVVAENEQLNKMKVSDVEGDTNVAGVFVNWTIDEQYGVDDMNVAMTGDMIIRIAEGVVVQKGDLLMSAGDGTAKPQGDDIVRSKTVAKVTSNHVTCTYADGSYCVPCVLMAC